MTRTPNIDLREDYQRNYIINGNFDFWQRGTSLNINGSTLYLADRFFGSEASEGDFTMSRSTDVPNADSLYSLQKQVTGADTSYTASQIALLGYRMEGYDLVNLRNKTFTLSFYVKASVTGIYSVAFRNSASDRSYVTEYTVNQVNTWEKKIITVRHIDSGTWNYDNQLGMRISWITACGPDLQTATLDQWQSGSFVASTNQVNLMATLGNTFKLSQVQITEGAEALSFRRAGRSIGEELRMCQRYYTNTWETNVSFPGAATSTGAIAQAPERSASNGNAVGGAAFPVEMRAIPTVLIYTPATGVVNRVRYNATDYAVTAGLVGTGAFTVVNGTGGVFPAASGACMLFHYEGNSEF